MFKQLLKPALLASLLLPLQAKSELDHPALSSNLDAFADPLMDALYAHSWGYQQFIYGYIATGCKWQAESNGYNPWDIETFVVTYDDCDVEWLVCRHTNAEVSIETFIDNFGRVPVHMRQAVKEIMLGGPGNGAYAANDVIVVFGSPDKVGIFLHETTHTLDWAEHFKYDGGGRLSLSWVWEDAYNTDWAVPDDYARNNQVENLAQFPGLLLFDRYFDGGGRIYDYLPNVGGIATQLNTMVDQADNGKYGPILERDNIQCTRRTPNSGWEYLGSDRRSTRVDRRVVGNGPLADRPDFPNTFEEQKAYIESKGVAVRDTRGLARFTSSGRTNCIGFV